MKVLNIEKKKLNLADFKMRSASEDDCGKVVDYDCLVVCDGNPAVLYHSINPELTSGIRWAVNTIDYLVDDRINGLKSTSSVFGFSPRSPVRRDFCGATAMARNFPKQHYVICKFADHLIELYKEYFPSVFERHEQVVSEKVGASWRLGETPFTSGIVNKNNPLKYHHDAGNFTDVLSNMIVLKRNVQGGRLSCPEFDLKFECADNHVVIFDGADILHGVTPIIKPDASDDFYRYSLVYYSLKHMWNCENINEEVKRIRRIKKQREFKRIN